MEISEMRGFRQKQTICIEPARLCRGLAQINTVVTEVKSPSAANYIRLVFVPLRDSPAILDAAKWQ
jgi:hypothetical protein